MRLRHQVRYDAPPEEVYAMLSDPGFRQKSCDAQGVLSADVTIEPTADGMTVQIDQVQPMQGVPAFARKIAGESTRAVQTEEWSDHSRATLTIRTPGKPTEITGTLRLEGDGSGTVETFDGEVKAKVPLIGGKLESLMADLFTAGMDAENQVGRAWLEGGR
ncbi:MAG: DUF2505 domain-containing protein [Nocardioidaceae bacterium]